MDNIPDELQTHPDPVVVVPVPVEPLTAVPESQGAETIEDLGTLADELAADAVICGERHEEILEWLEKIQTDLASRPSSEQLTELRTQIENLRVEVRNLKPSDFPPPSVPSTPVLANPNQPSEGHEEPVETPANPVVPITPEKPKKRRRI